MTDSGFIMFMKKSQSTKSSNKLSQEKNILEHFPQKVRAKEKHSNKQLKTNTDLAVVTLNRWAQENIGDSPPTNKAHSRNLLAISPKEREQRSYWRYVKSKGATKSKNTKRYFDQLTTNPSDDKNDVIIQRLQEELTKNEILFEEKLNEQKQFYHRQQKRSVHVVRMCLKTIQENEERAKLIPQLEMEIARLKRQLVECRYKSPTQARHLKVDYGYLVSDHDSPLADGATDDELDADDADAMQPSTSIAIHKYFEDVIFK